MIKKALTKPLTIMFALALLLSVGAPTEAQNSKITSEKNVSTAPSQQQGPTDPAELEAFLDGLLSKEMEENHIAGAAVSVVKDGKLFFAKGYGDADMEKGIPLTPNRRSFASDQSASCSPGRQ